jgi:hypothetical protein
MLTKPMKDSKIIYPPARCIVGKFYQVPHVVLVNGDAMPILGDTHEDREFFPEAPKHWHVDHRFTSKKQQDLMMPLLILRQKSECFTAIHKIGNVVWELQDPTFPDFYKKNEPRRSNGEVVYKKTKCRAENTHTNWEHFECNQESKVVSFETKEPLMKLRSAYCGKSLIESNGEYFCPHKGTKVDVSSANEHGEVHCPAHLLKFDEKTLKSI